MSCGSRCRGRCCDDPDAARLASVALQPHRGFTAGQPEAPLVAPAEPDLTFVGTRTLFEEIARRHDGCVLVCVRKSVGDDGGCSVVFLSEGVSDTAGFLQKATDLVSEGKLRDLREGDL